MNLEEILKALELKQAGFSMTDEKLKNLELSLLADIAVNNRQIIDNQNKLLGKLDWMFQNRNDLNIQDVDDTKKL